MNRYAFATIALAAGAVAFSTSAAEAQLAHRYTFNDDTGNDSVGTSNGTLLANGTITGGQLVTTGTAAMTTGLSLPASTVAGLNGSFSIQQFYTSTAPQADFAVGSSFSDRGAVNGTDNPTGQANFLIFQPRRGGLPNPSSFAATGPNIAQHNFLGATVDAAGTTYDVLFSYDAVSGNGSYYINGVLASDVNGVTSTFAIPGFDLSTKGARIGINGNGPFADAGFNGSTDDFRIYGQSVDATQAAALFALGAGASNAAINAAVTVVPEPTALGLLGVAGLGLLRRRRA